MNIGALGHNNNQMFHVSRINQSASRIHGGTGNQPQKQDKLSLSPEGKRQNLLNNLMKQKQDIIDRKNELAATNAENGGSTSAIQPQLDLMDEQLQAIDDQIATARTEELKPKNEEKETEGTIYEKPKTEAEVSQDKLSDITKLSNNLESIKIVDSAKTKTDQEIKILKVEISSNIGNAEAKYKQVSELSTESNELTMLRGELINDTIESTTEIAQPDNAAKTEEQENPLKEILKAAEGEDPTDKDLAAESKNLL